MTRTTNLTRVGVLSLGKTLCAIYGGLGLVIGLLYGLAIFFVSVAGAIGGEGEALLGILLALGMILIIPIIYAILGFLFGLLLAFIFNLVAGKTGGLELTFDDEFVSD